MKTDYTKMKKMIYKICGKTLIDKKIRRQTNKLHQNYGIYEQQSSSLQQLQRKEDFGADPDYDEEVMKLKEIEEEFNITGVNQYK